jgi:hypothetical protein
MTEAILTESDLRALNGTDRYYRASLGLLFTDGIKFLAEKGGAYWLIDAIASHQDRMLLSDGMLQDFQIWDLSVNPETRSAILTCSRDTDDVFRTQEIPFTDFPMPQIKLYVQRGEGCYVLMLPSEY